MTKTIKMSLAAVVAVAGIASSAAAVDYKGKLYVENWASTPGGDASTTTGYEIDFDVTATAKINDNFKAVVGVEADTNTNDNGYDNYDDVKGDGTVKGDLRPEVEVDEAYVAYSGNGLGVKMGRQNINTPTSDGEDGEGVMATYTMAGITAAAAHFGNNEISNGNDVSAIAVLGAAGPVNFQAWQVGIHGPDSGSSAHTTLAVGAKFSGVSVGGRVATSSYDAAGSKDGQTMIVTVAAKAGKVGLSLAHLMNDEDGAALTTDPSSANTAEMVHLHASNRADTTATILAASMPFANGYSAAVKYGMADVAGTDHSEVVLQLNKKFAKSLSGSLRYADYDDSADGKSQLRADLTYKF